jgi:DNA-binding beta-propeller fold protein YncE
MKTRRLLWALAYSLPLSLLAHAEVQAGAEEPSAKGSNGKRPQDTALRLPTGQLITPTALRGAVQQPLNPGLPQYPNFVAGEAVASELSPDGQTLAVLCAGHNSLVKPDGTTDVENSTQYIFLYDVGGANRDEPLLKQVIKQTNSHVGLVFSPDGNKLYAAGGRDDVVYVYTNAAGTWSPAAPIALGHGGIGLGINVAPNASGLDISADGRTLVVANNYNDSISVIDTESGTLRYEHDLRPYHASNEGQGGGVGGTFPFGVVIKGNETAYVSSDRNREVIAIDIRSPTEARLIRRIELDGNALGMTLDAAGAQLFVAQDNADQVAVIDTRDNRVVEKIDARAPEGMLPDGQGRERYTGAGTFSVTLSPDQSTLYAVNAGSNSVAVIPLRGDDAYSVKGLIPTAYEPHDITFSADGKWMYLVNGKSVTGPNPGHLSSYTRNSDALGGPAVADASRATNEYQFQLERASLVSAPVPRHRELARLTRQVAENNFYGVELERDERRIVKFLQKRIKHIIYIVKENRTFDQVLGDLGNGSNGDPTLTQFGDAITPNHHALAREFVTLDNFMDPGDGSMDGWSWTLQGRVTNVEALTQQINYAFVSRGLSYESEGSNRNVPVNFATVAERDAALGPAGTTRYSEATAALPGGTQNLLTGTGNHASSDAPFEEQSGYIFDAVLAAGRSVRNYGLLVRNVGSIGTIAAPITDPFGAGEVQVNALEPELVPATDMHFRGYDQNYPDLWRYDEWKREFDQFVAGGNLPNLSMVRLGHDHMGNFATALGGFNTPETQVAENDLAVGLMVEAVANSPYAADTLFIIIEDDCQDGPDHVDSHRATTYVVGPYVKQHAVISTHYSQVNALRTIEDILDTAHINLNTAFQKPMLDVFDIRASGKWSFTAQASTVLEETTAAKELTTYGVEYARGPRVRSKHDAAFWAKLTAEFDFSEADRVPTARFNRVLWQGLMGDRPYPALRNPSAAAAKD